MIVDQVIRESRGNIGWLKISIQSLCIYMTCMYVELAPEYIRVVTVSVSLTGL